ncbi:class I SAM-dependent methyltransferase [Streptomyces sviceus]|uniref:class I SAM-dependent methyltransferase n=1 Tax=Streptomyces sviceus TaxID=285530 RepID=UPI00332525A9
MHGQRLLDAGCGIGYFSRTLARRGARVVGVEPTDVMCSFAREREVELKHGVTHVQADLTRLPDLGAPFDAVVCSRVLMAIPGSRRCAPAWKVCARAACSSSSSPPHLISTDRSRYNSTNSPPSAAACVRSPSEGSTLP